MIKLLRLIIFVIVVLSLITLVVVGIKNMEERIEEEERFCESNGMFRANSLQPNIQCMTEDGDLKHFSRKMVRDLNQRSKNT